MTPILDNQFVIILILLCSVHIVLSSYNILCDSSLDWAKEPSNNLFTIDHSACTATITGGTTRKQSSAIIYIDVGDIFSNAENYPIDFTISAYSIGKDVLFGMIAKSAYISQTSSSTYVNVNDNTYKSVIVTTQWGSAEAEGVVQTCSIDGEKDCGYGGLYTKIMARDIGSIGLKVWNLTNSSAKPFGVTFKYASLTGLAPAFTDGHSKRKQFGIIEGFVIACVALVSLVLITILILWYWTRSKLDEQLLLIQDIHVNYGGLGDNDNN